MIKRIFTFSLLFFLIVALFLHIAGVTEINLLNGGNWLRSLFDKFSTLDGLRIPEFKNLWPTLSEDANFFEVIGYTLSYIAACFTAIGNLFIGTINFLIDIIKFEMCILWMLIESPSILATT